MYRPGHRTGKAQASRPSPHPAPLPHLQPLAASPHPGISPAETTRSEGLTGVGGLYVTAALCHCCFCLQGGM